VEHTPQRRRRRSARHGLRTNARKVHGRAQGAPSAASQPVAAYGLSDIAVGYIGFEVNGIDALVARVREAGARVVSQGGVVKLQDKTRAVLVRDPDVGGFVELFEPVGRAR
jgi:hypothetical protein